MKTFETEKHNIPEGATHYRDECKDFAFVWVKKTGDNSYVWDCDRWCEAVIINRDLEITPIPQTNIETPEEKGVEWVNGDMVCKVDQVIPIGVFVGLDRTGRAVVELNPVMAHANNGNSLTTFGLHNIKKPETQQKREERERLEAAYDLYSHVCKDGSPNGRTATFEEFNKGMMTSCREEYLAIVDKTNYRKEG